MALLQIDHLVFGTPDMEEGIQAIRERLGVTATPGGQHLGLGTRNALVSLGPEMYLEVIGPDTAQAKPHAGRQVGIDGLSSPRLVTWAVRTTDLDASVRAARQNGVEVGPIAQGERKRPDGVTLSWRLTTAVLANESMAAGTIPFLIDWGDSPHPAASLPPGCKLTELRIEHPQPENIGRQLVALGRSIRVTLAPEPRLVAVIESPKGRVELR